ncbi:glycoside hydrolase family 97 N-terminal domain-containing protein [Sphingobacterium sp. E70]|uniref:glycoside hydrolase family 97 N-terminal domain-containing protein n=1 Tax=Sphingobacterium sp. E70 TaxID=2853439 RepID=UPI00359CB750
MRAFIVTLFFAITSSLSAQTYSLLSPDGKICLDIDLSNGLSYAVSYKGRQVIDPSPLGFELQDEPPCIKGLCF